MTAYYEHQIMEDMDGQIIEMKPTRGKTNRKKEGDESSAKLRSFVTLFTLVHTIS